MASDIIPALAVVRGSKYVEAGFEPIVEAVGDFDRFMKLMIGRISSVGCGLRTLKREITVELHHRVARLHGFVRVDLNLVVALRARRRYGMSERDTECNAKKDSIEFHHALDVRRGKNRYRQFSGMWMRFVVDIHQLPDGSVRVFLRRCQRLVAEQFLDRAQVSAVGQ